MRIIRLTPENREQAVQDAAKVLREGGLVLYPTDTLYGLAAHIRHAGALDRVQDVKAREVRKPLSIVVRDLESLERYAHLEDAARALAERHLPGALTLVLVAKDTVPAPLVLAGKVGLRIPLDDFALALARVLGEPYTSTSANRTGQRTPTTVDAILEHIGPAIEHIDLVIDDGPRDSAHASTVVTLVEGAPYILREGILSREELGL